MENMAAKVTAAYFDTQGLHYDRRGEEGEALIAGFSMKNLDGVQVLMVFDKDGEGVKIRTFDFVKVPEGKKEAVYKVCSLLNMQYRWIKFYVDEEENMVVAQDDAVIQLDSCGPEVLRCCAQLTRIADLAYPEIMKAMFA